MMKLRRMLVGAAGAVLAASLWTAPAAALCSTSERWVFYIEFTDGSAQVAPEVRQRFAVEILPQLTGDRYVEEFYVLASGDIAEGAEWDRASPEARTHDQLLGRRRTETVQAMILSHTPQIPSAPITMKVQENRQVLTAAEQAATPGITATTKAGIAATIRSRTPAVPAGAPVPTC